MKRSLVIGLTFFLSATLNVRKAYGSSSPGFVISGPSVATPINNDSTVNIPISVTPANGFTGGIKLQCALGNTPPGAVNLPICNFPLIFPTVTITGTQPAQTSLLVATAGQALPQLSMTTSGRLGVSQYLALIAFPTAMLLLGLNPGGLFAKRKVLGCLLLGGLFLGVGCGGGSMTPKTTPGTYTFLMHGVNTSTGMISTTGSVTVNVQ